MLWTDKYRPQELSEVVGNKKEIKIITDWVSEWKKGNPQIPLLLVGPPGIGKTTLALIIAKEFSESASRVTGLPVDMFYVLFNERKADNVGVGGVLLSNQEF